MTEAQLVDAVAVVLAGYSVGVPDPEVLIKVMGVNPAYVLTTIVREGAMLPDEIDEVLDLFCAHLRHVTRDMIHDADAQRGAWAHED
jgi:hypothetical protein